MSANIIPFMEGRSFDPELTHAMGETFDEACNALNGRGQPAVVQEVIARHVIEVARTGERDPNKICERVLTVFGLLPDK